MTDVELLPLPELPRQIEGYSGDYWEAGQVEEYATDYARACVEANLAPLQAEIKALRAEMERLRADRDSWEQQASDRVADWHAEHLRAERLAEALRKLEEREQSDEALLRQALEALERGAWDTLSGRNAAFAIRERLGLWQEE